MSQSDSLPAETPTATPSRAGTLQRWIGILAAYFSTQTLVQLLGIASGLLLVNFLPIQEFALYTLAASFVSFFTFATDLGSSTSLVYFYRHAGDTGDSFPQLLSAAYSLRRAAFAIGILVVSLVFLPTALGRGFSPLEVGLGLLAVALTVWFQIRSSLSLLVLRLHNAYAASYRAEIIGACLRLLLIVGLLATALTMAAPALLATTAATATTALLAAARVPQLSAAPAEPRHRRRIFRYLLPTLPSALYFATQGPLIIWLATTFGETKNIAEVGALGRLGLVVGIFSGMTSVVFLPRLARIADNAHYFRRFLQFGSLLLAIGIALLLAAWLAPGAFLFVLGPKYRGLTSELLLVVGASVLTLLDGYCVSVNLARAWTRFQGLTLVVQVAFQAWLLFALRLDTTANLLRFNLLSASAALALQFATTSVGFIRPRTVQWT